MYGTNRAFTVLMFAISSCGVGVFSGSLDNKPKTPHPKLTFVNQAKSDLTVYLMHVNMRIPNFNLPKNSRQITRAMAGARYEIVSQQSQHFRAAKCTAGGVNQVFTITYKNESLQCTVVPTDLSTATGSCQSTAPATPVRQPPLCQVAPKNVSQLGERKFWMGSGGEVVQVRKMQHLGHSRLWYLQGFISRTECAILQQRTQGWLQPAMTQHADGSRGTGHRIASSAPVYYEFGSEHSHINNLIHRIFQFAKTAKLNLTVEGQEPLSVTRYKHAELYKPHCDGPCTANVNRHRERVATMIMYCEQAEKGGATLFTNANLTLRPEPGDAIFFEYATDNTSITKHMGCPVERGEKLIVTQWLRRGVSRDMDYLGSVWGEPPFIPINTHNLRHTHFSD